MTLIGEMKYLTIGDSTYSVPTSGGGGGGTVTSVQVQATSPVQSSNSSAQSAILSTTISLANGYGDTKNPYASKSKNLVLASPTNASGDPSFRALDKSDIPDLSDDYLPADTSIPSKTSDLTNDSGFITGYTETDPTVPSWAKASTKPSYTASEVGAVPTSRTVNGKALSSDITLSASDVGAQETLVSGTNIKTVNGTSILGSGDIPISGGGGGTVTSVGVSNATNGGLSVSGSPVTGSGTISIGHSNVLTSAQTTQAVYPIKIDKNGHISAYGTAVTSMPASDVSSWAKASTKPTYTASEVGALPSSTTIPSAGTGSSYPVMDGTRALGSQAGYARVDHVHPSDTSRVPTTRTVNGKALSSDITLSASDVSALPASTSIPSKTSDLTNDSGFITGYTETDPTVPSWAKASTKPSYTASEVGAQETLVSGTNIKTINNESILGSGNISISGGEVYSTDDTASLITGTTYHELSDVITLSQGTWVVDVSARYGGNSSGRRTCTIYSGTSSNSLAEEASARTTTYPVDTATCALHTSCIVSSSTGNVYIRVYGMQNSGSTLSVTVYIKAVKIR